MHTSQRRSPRLLPRPPMRTCLRSFPSRFIVPRQNEQSRSTIEMKDSTARPGVASKVENMDQYTTIFVGFPIWWYTAPRIVNTFLEQYDLTGKTIIPFATSGGSDMGKSGEDLKKASAPNANWILPGKVLNGNPPVDSLKVWVESLK